MCDSNALPLTAAPSPASLPDECAVAIQESDDKAVCINRLCRRHGGLMRGLLQPVADVVLNRTAEDLHVLGHHSALMVQSLEKRVANVLAVEENAHHMWAVHAEYGGGLAAARAANNGGDGAVRKLAGDADQNNSTASRLVAKSRCSPASFTPHQRWRSHCLSLGQDRFSPQAR